MNIIRPNWHQTFIDILEIINKRSLCVKLQTSALLVKDNQIIAIGYNGTFNNHIECKDYWLNEFKNMNLPLNDECYTFDDWLQTEQFKKLHRDWSVKNEFHAESNVLKWHSKNINKDCILYCYYSPCDICAKDIIANDIKKVYYKKKYKRGNESLITLQNANITVSQI